MVQVDGPGCRIPIYGELIIIGQDAERDIGSSVDYGRHSVGLELPPADEVAGGTQVQGQIIIGAIADNDGIRRLPLNGAAQGLG